MLLLPPPQEHLVRLDLHLGLLLDRLGVIGDGIPKRGVLADHAAGESAVELGPESDLADLLGLVAAHDVALLVEAGIVHLVELVGKGSDLGGARVRGRQRLRAGFRGGGVLRRPVHAAGGFRAGHVVRLSGRAIRGGFHGRRQRGLQRGRAGIGAESSFVTGLLGRDMAWSDRGLCWGGG